MNQSKADSTIIKEFRLIRTLNGKTPKIHKDAFVSEFAYLVGDVEVGAYSSIWPGVVIRGDSGKIKIGENTCVQDNSVIHGDADVEICDFVVIGHRVMCHAAVINNYVLLGNGSVVNDGVIIGEESIIGSGAMVVENMEIAKNSLVLGVPGRVKGEVKERHLELIKFTSKHYVEKGKLYKSEGLI